jgi:hypothetical protein
MIKASSSSSSSSLPASLSTAVFLHTADAFLLTMIKASSSPSSSSYSSSPPASLSTAVSLHTSRCFPSNYDHIIITIIIIIIIIITNFIVYSCIPSY